MCSVIRLPYCTIVAIFPPVDEFTSLVFLTIAGALHPGFERRSDLRPFALNNTVKNRVTVGAIWHDHVITQHALFHRSQAFDSPLRFAVKVMRFELHTDRSYYFKCMTQEQIFTLAIDTCP